LETALPRDKNVPDDKGKVKFRFVEFELEGSNTTLQESLRNIASAITHGSVNTSVRTIETKSVRAIAPPSGGNGATSEVIEADIEEAGENQVAGPQRGATQKSVRRSAPRSPKILNIDLESGKVTLKDFCEPKKPTTDINKFLVIAAWFKQQCSIEEVTMDHIHTAYRHMGWHTPADATQPLRIMKTKRYGYFGKGKAKGAYAINHVGENAVSKMKTK
jgi:hypothetical protein